MAKRVQPTPDQVGGTGELDRGEHGVRTCNHRAHPESHQCGHHIDADGSSYHRGKRDPSSVRERSSDDEGHARSGDDDEDERRRRESQELTAGHYVKTVARLSSRPKVERGSAAGALGARKGGGGGCARGIIVRVVALRASALWLRRC